MASIEEVLARQDELRAQHEALEERLDEIHVEREQIRREEDPPRPDARPHQIPLLPTTAASSAALAQARIAAVRGADGGEVERLEARIKDVERRLQDGLGHERVLDEAAQAVLDDLKRLHVDEFQAFATVAERYTAAATEALEALRAPYEAAIAAWEMARVAWAPTAAANGLRRVDRCPLPPPESVFGAPEHGQPIDGAPLTYQPVDPADEREPIQVVAGTGQHDALRTDPDYELVAGQAAHHAAPIARPADVEPVAREASTA